MPNLITLNCVLLGESLEQCFKITIDENADFRDLKEAIASKRPNRLKDVDANELALYKTDVPITIDDAPFNPALTRSNKLALGTIVEVFSSPTSLCNVHVVVVKLVHTPPPPYLAPVVSAIDRLTAEVIGLRAYFMSL